MAKQIKFTIIKSLIFNTVKNVTFKKGLIDKGADERNTTVAFHEQAGDEEYHERLLQRSYYVNVELLKTRLSDYLVEGGLPADDPTISEEESDGTNEIILRVSDRFNEWYVKSLARLCSAFIEDCMISDWYAVIDEKKSAFFTALAEKDMMAILKTFSKTSPTPPTYLFPTGITIRYPVLTNIEYSESSVIPVTQLFKTPWIIGRGEMSDISYVLTGEDDRKPIDDIIVRCDDTCCHPAINNNGKWCLKGMNTGFTVVTLFSRHNDQVYAKFAVRIV